MSNDPQTIVDAIDQASDAFKEIGHGRPTPEAGIDSDGSWETQLTKACKVLDAAAVIRDHNGHYTAVIELCFGAIERSIEAYAVAMAGDEVTDFRDHEYSYQRAHEIGLLDQSTADAMRELYSDNRTESYYGGSRPTDEQADSMMDLATAVHEFVVDQIRQGGVCLCR